MGMNTAAANGKLAAPPMVYIEGEEMTREVMKMVLDKWISPYLDTSKWQHFDLSCRNRDKTGDKALADAIAAGTSLGAIFKEPTITPTAEQAKEMGIKPLGSPNGKMRKAWNGYSIDRDTITVAGLENQMGYKKPVLFCRHAVGGEYGAGYDIVGPGQLTLLFHPTDGGPVRIIDQRKVTDQTTAAAIYDNPLDNVEQLAHHFFQRALEANVTPYVVTKKTVFKWQEPFWEKMEAIFNRDYKAKFEAKGLLKNTGGKLRHLLSDDAAMKMVQWKDGGFAMVAHNYDGDWLTDLEAQVYKSPGFISSALTGVKPNGQKIMEFEASHGTIADQYAKFKAGEETSVNPLGMVHALRGAIDHSANLAVESNTIQKSDAEKIKRFTAMMYESMCDAMAAGKATRDLSGPEGLTTEQFVDEVANRLQAKVRGGFASIGNGSGMVKTA